MTNQAIKPTIIDLLHYKHQIILQGPPGTGKTREAKCIAKQLLGLNDNDSLEGNEQFKLIQFHPSYSYEDFVRGIVAQPNETGGGIVYTAENKVLAKFAEEALKAFQEPIKWENFRDFLEKEKKEGREVYFDEGKELKYNFIQNNELRYLSRGNHNLAGIPIEEFCQRNLDDKFDSFYKNYHKWGWKFITDYFIKWANDFKRKKSYFLVIDEINRANLSTVLGELIYALEYRGESVESMYALDDTKESRKIILPPNLYIIGTMNTTDRSVGHIDYAIRRRFAFVNMLPKELEGNFDKNLFKAVSKLFIENYDEYINNTDTELKRAKTLSPEFKPEDVWLGQSYFIQKKYSDGKDVPMSIRWEYEIKPILLEYIKDGILIDNIKIEEQMQEIKTLVYENNPS